MGVGGRVFADRRDAGRQLTARLRPFAVYEPVAVALFPESDIIVDPGPITTSGTASAVATQPPSLVSKRTRVDVFAVGSDNQLWQKTLDHEGWHGHKAPDGHDTENWKASKFDHNKTAFKLDGKHINVVCSKCHKPQQQGSFFYVKYKLKVFTCESCHS